MMKKLGMLVFILGLVIAFAMPVLAFTIDGAKGDKMYIGGTFMTDFGYWSRSKELIGGPGNTTLSDKTEFIFTVPNHSNLRGTLQVGNVGGYWELGMGANLGSTTTSSSDITALNSKYVETRYLYGFYNFGNCQILAGKTDGHIYSVVPWQVMGVWQLHVYGFGWGNVYDQRNTQVRFTQNVTKQFSYQISLVQPQEYFDSALTTATVQQKSYVTYPLIAAKVKMNFGMISLYPAVAYQNVKWDNVPGGFDDNMTTWYGVLPVVVKIGAFTGTIQGGYGQNLGNVSSPVNGVLTGETAFHAYFRDASGKIKNSTGINGFVDLAYTFGPATPHIYFGYDNAKNSDKWQVGDDNNTKLMYGASINYKVADTFYVIPEFTYYDYGKQPGVASKPDIGKEWMGGVQFRFVF